VAFEKEEVVWIRVEEAEGREKNIVTINEWSIAYAL
jgi:hypothetical protein